MKIVVLEDDHNSTWTSDSAAFLRNMLAKMVWKEGVGIGNSWHGMTTNLKAYLNSNTLGVGATTNLHSDSDWSKTNDNFNGIL